MKMMELLTNKKNEVGGAVKKEDKECSVSVVTTDGVQHALKLTCY